MHFLLENGYPIPSVLTFLDRIDGGYSSSLQIWLNLLFSVGTLGPFISATITIGIIYGTDNLKEFFKRFINFNFDKKWWIVIFLIPLGLTGINAVFSIMSSGGNTAGFFQFDYPWYFAILMLLNQTFTSGLEEPGWRGFATPEFQKIKNAEDSGFYIGIIWGIWHFPFLIYLYSSLYAGNTYLIVLSLVGYVALIVPKSIIDVWIYNNTRSIGLLIIAHGFDNFIPQIIMGGVVDSSGGVIIAVATWILSGLITKKYGKEHLALNFDEELLSDFTIEEADGIDSERESSKGT